MAPRGFPARGAGGVLSYFTRHGTAANLLLVVMIVLGVLAGTRLRSQFFPDVVIERVTVSVAWPGAGPEDVDTGIVQLLEPVLLGVDGVESTSSTSKEGRALIVLEFEPGTDMGRAADDVKAAVDSVTGLPEDAEDPVIRRAIWRDRVTDVVISGPVSTDQLARFADEFINRLFRLGVTRTRMRGIAGPETVVEVDSAALIRHDVTLRQIATAIGAEARADPAGDLAGGAARLRTGQERRSADEVGDVVLRVNPDGSRLRVRDVARVILKGVTRNRSYFVGDDPAISIRVDRTATGDAIGIEATVRKAAEEFQRTLPKGVTVTLIRTRAENIRQRLNILLDNGMMGLALVVGLLFLFLNARTAFWVAAGIPASVATALALMYAAGLTINMISLFALIITLGIIVDDAIVVGEHADFRARRLKEPPVIAAENAARRMAAPVFSATVTTIIAFLSLLAIRGRFGSLIEDIPFTVIVVLTASLMECFLILPNHMSHALAAASRRHWYDWPSRAFNRLFGWFRERLFRPFVRLVIRLRYPVLAGTVWVLAVQAGHFLKGDVTWRFFNAPERGSITGNFAMRDGATRADTLAMMRELQRATAEVAAEYEQRYGRNPVTFVLGQVGGNGGRGLAGTEGKDPDLLGAVSIELIDADLRPYSYFRFLSDVQQRVRRLPQLQVLSFRGFHAGPGGDSIDVQLSGASAVTLKRAAEALKTRLARFPEVSALEDDLDFGKDEIILDLTAQGHALGFTVEGLGRELRDRLSGITAARYAAGTRTAEIRVQLPEDEASLDFLDRMMMRTPRGDYVPLSDIVTVTTRTSFAAVLRENGERVVSVTADLSEDDPRRAAEVMELLRSDILPGIARDFGVGTRLSGLSEQENAFIADAEVGFILALIGIYLTLAWIFSSWTRPLVVMAIIPFGLVGTIFGHMQWDVPLSMFSVVGMIGMTGIIINDSIVLVSTIDEYARDRGLMQAIVDGVADRLRPVLLTTLTTVLGLMPLLFETSRQAQFLKPTVITLSYGLGFGMVLVLLVVPALLAAQRDIGSRMRALRRMAAGRHAVWPQRLVLLGAGLAGAALFVASLGWAQVTGRESPLAALLRDAMPGLPAALPGSLLELGLFITGMAAICVLATLLSMLLFALGRRSRAA